MEKKLTQKDIAPGNHYFWWFYLTGLRGYDPVRELNLDDILEELVDTACYVPNAGEWYGAFCPDEGADGDGLYENPRYIAAQLTQDISFAIEFHQSETTYYLNGRYIGNQGGHFQAWFLTLDELKAFDKFPLLGLLMLPMASVEETQRGEAEGFTERQLSQLPLFAPHAKALAPFVVNGLTITGEFSKMPGVGLTNSQNHSVRNITQYPRYKEDVIVLNKALAAFVG